jgi:hypothetical protein
MCQSFSALMSGVQENILIRLFYNKCKSKPRIKEKQYTKSN